MATRLNDSNLKKVISEFTAKGYTKKFWQDYRAPAAAKSGVGKAMTGLAKMGLPANGQTKRLPVQNLVAIKAGLKDLIACLKKAQGKCKKGQEHTKKLCEAMIRHTSAEITRAGDRIGKASVIMGRDSMQAAQLITAKYYTVSANIVVMSDITESMEDVAEDKDANMKASIAKMKKLEKDWLKEHTNIMAEMDKLNVAMATLISLNDEVFGDLVKVVKERCKKIPVGRKLIKTTLAQVKQQRQRAQIAKGTLKKLAKVG